MESITLHHIGNIYLQPEDIMPVTKNYLLNANISPEKAPNMSITVENYGGEGLVLSKIQPHYVPTTPEYIIKRLDQYHIFSRWDIPHSITKSYISWCRDWARDMCMCICIDDHEVHIGCGYPTCLCDCDLNLPMEEVVDAVTEVQ